MAKSCRVHGIYQGISKMHEHVLIKKKKKNRKQKQTKQKHEASEFQPKHIILSYFSTPKQQLKNGCKLY